MCGLARFGVLVLRIPLSLGAPALHAVLYLHVLAYEPSGMSVTSLQPEDTTRQSTLHMAKKWQNADFPGK